MSDEQSLIRVFVEALKESVEESLKGPGISSRLVKMDLDPSLMHGEISVASTLSLISSSYVGTINLFFPKTTFLKYYEVLLGEVPTEITSEVADASSELLNILYGLTKKKVNERGGDFAPSLPSSFLGTNLSIISSSHKSLFFHFESDVGKFFVVLSVTRAEGQRVA